MTYCDQHPNDTKCDNTQIIEALDSRKLTRDKVSNRYEVHLFLRGTNDECVARARLDPDNPQGTGLPRTFPAPASAGIGGLSVPFQNYTLELIGWELWECTAVYAWDGPVQRQGTTVVSIPTNISFSTQGGSATLSRSIMTVNSIPYKDDGLPAGYSVAPDLNQAIGYDMASNTVKGVKVPSPLPRYSESWIFTRRQMLAEKGPTYQEPDQDGRGFHTNTWNNLMHLWSRYTNSVHGPPVIYDDSLSSGDPGYDAELEAVWQDMSDDQKGNFREWKPGEVRLDNVSIRQVGLDHFEVAFDFSITFNTKVNISFSGAGGYSQTVDREGWDYWWTQYGLEAKETKDKDDARVGDISAPTPIYHYFERIYERADFGRLGIGTGPLGVYIPFSCINGIDAQGGWNVGCRK